MNYASNTAQADMSAAPKNGLGERGDDFYELLIATHQGRDLEESCALNVRLVLLFAQEIGDFGRLETLLVQAAAD